MKVERKLPLKDAWVIWFLLGTVMLNYPFLHIFNKNILIFGIPLTLLYFFIGWPISIVVVYIFAVYLGRHSEQESAASSREETKDGGAT